LAQVIWLQAETLCLGRDSIAMVAVVCALFLLAASADAFVVGAPRAVQAGVPSFLAAPHQEKGRHVQTSTLTGVSHSVACVAIIGLGVVAALNAATRKHRRSGLARRAWGDDIVFHIATVKENVEAAKGLRLITIEAPDVVSDPYGKAGQCVMAKPDDDAKASFYAISSPPGGDGAFEFLIGETEANKWMTDVSKGDAVKLSPAMGKGFATDGESWEGVSQVGLFAAGSGIAPIRSVIESGALDGKVSRLYLGARTEQALAFADRFGDWKKRGVEVVPVLSKPEAGWSGRTGYVQQAFQEDEERGEGFVLAGKHGALLCGQKEMVAAVREVYSGLGVPEDRTLTNF